MKTSKPVLSGAGLNKMFDIKLEINTFSKLPERRMELVSVGIRFARYFSGFSRGRHNFNII